MARTRTNHNMRIILLLFAAALAYGQPSRVDLSTQYNANFSRQPYVVPFVEISATPTGACLPYGAVVMVRSTGAVWLCVLGTWVQLIGSGGGGGLTSVGLSMPTGFTVTGSPRTTNGTIAVTTSLSGILKASGGAFSAATAGTDHVGGVGNLTTAGRLVSVSAAGTVTEQSAVTVSGGVVTATGFAGPLTGNVTGNVTGNTSGSAGTVTSLSGHASTELSDTAGIVRGAASLDTTGRLPYTVSAGVAGKSAVFWNNSTGRLGINSDSPDHALHIADPSRWQGIKLTGSQTPGMLFAPTSGAVKQAQIFQDTNYLHLASAGEGERLTVELATGNIGLGILTPGYRLDASTGTVNAAAYRIGGTLLASTHLSDTAGLVRGAASVTTSGRMITASGSGTIAEQSAVTVSAGVVTATGFSGPLTGNVTGNTSGSAGTVTSLSGHNATELTMATAKLLGRSTASTGAVEEITVGSGLTLSGGSLAGAAMTRDNYVIYRLAVCQNTSASLAVSTGTSAYPTATCVTGTNTQKGVATFSQTGAEWVQDHFSLPSDWTGAVDVTVKWNTSATSGNAQFNVSTICVADAETLDPAFNTATSWTSTAKGTTLQLNNSTQTSVTVTGCAAGEELFWKLSRTNGGSDTLAAALNIHTINFKIRRSY
jgi:hypothetical protein